MVVMQDNGGACQCDSRSWGRASNRRAGSTPGGVTIPV